MTSLHGNEAEEKRQADIVSMDTWEKAQLLRELAELEDEDRQHMVWIIRMIGRSKRGEAVPDGFMELWKQALEEARTNQQQGPATSRLWSMYEAYRTKEARNG